MWRREKPERAVVHVALIAVQIEPSQQQNSQCLLRLPAQGAGRVMAAPLCTPAVKTL